MHNFVVARNLTKVFLEATVATNSEFIDQAHFVNEHCFLHRMVNFDGTLIDRFNALGSFDFFYFLASVAPIFGYAGYNNTLYVEDYCNT